MSELPPLEVRVHGVSGTPPDALLNRPLVEQIAGDNIAGFWRPRRPDERRDDPPESQTGTSGDGPEMVGYCWGGLTSGSAFRALWLVLLPFTLVNVAPRGRPLRAAGWQKYLIWGLCRWLALLLTGLFVLTGVGIGDDLMGWQCAHTTKCKNASPSKVFRYVFDKHQLSDEHVLLLGSIVPVLVLSLLWLVSSRTANRYEKTVGHGAAGTADMEERPGWNDVEISLGSTLMWRSADQVRRLRATHMQAGFALIMWSVAAPTERRWHVDRRDASGLVEQVSFVVRSHPVSLAALAVIAYSAVCLWLPTYVGRGPSGRWRAASTVVWFVLGGFGVWLVGGLAFGHNWIRVAGEASKQELPKFGATVFIDFGAAMVVLGLLACVVFLAALRGSRADTGQHAALRPALLGMTTAAFAALGVFYAATFGSGVYTLAAGWLTTGSLKPGFSSVKKIYDVFDVPRAVPAASRAFLVSAIALAAIVLLAGAVFAAGYLLAGARKLTLIALGVTAVLGAAGATVAIVLGNRPLLVFVAVVGVVAVFALVVEMISSPRLVKPAAVDLDYPHPTDDGAREKSIWRALYLGRLVDTAPFVVVPVIVAGLIITFVYALPLLSSADSPPGYCRHLKGIWSCASAEGAGYGAYLSVLTIIGIITLGGIAFRTRSLRRSVGILWDVASFWPRASHPLAPPCYAERTVPDLVTYLSAQKSRPAIVLAAHSQGTVISAAAIRQLMTFDVLADKAAKKAAADKAPDQTATDHTATDRAVPSRAVFVVPRLGYLTFGCVLRRLYGRYFPAYFGPAELRVIETALGGAAPRWRNLWRYTDYLGGQVTAGPPPVLPAAQDDLPTLGLPRLMVGPQPWEWHSPDPPAFARDDGDTAYSVPHRHSDFSTDRSGYFQSAVADLVHQVRGDANSLSPSTPPAEPNGAPGDT